MLGAPGAFLYTGSAVLGANNTLAVSDNMDSPRVPPQAFLGVAVARGRILEKYRDGEGDVQLLGGMGDDRHWGT